MNTYERIKVETKRDIGIITLNRPEARNILDTKTLRELEGALVGLAKDEKARVLIITGNWVFSAGSDIKELREMTVESAEAFSRLGHKICILIETMEKPVIAVVGGYAFGGGCELALACDLRIAAENARLGQPEVNLGLIPGFGATQRLARLVGIGKAKELILTGRVIDAQEAESIGLVNKVVRQEELMDKAEEIAVSITEKSPLTLKMAKSLINASHVIEKGLDLEIVTFSQCFTTMDHTEGINAFFEKRKPVFKGK